MKGSLAIEDEERRSLQFKYDITAWFYDILDYPWERQYRHWRPQFVEDVHGEVIEAGVGTGRNLKYYNSDVNLIAIDLCKAMVKIAKKRGRSAVCRLPCGVNRYFVDAKQAMLFIHPRLSHGLRKDHNHLGIDLHWSL